MWTKDNNTNSCPNKKFWLFKENRGNLKAIAYIYTPSSIHPSKAWIWKTINGVDIRKKDERKAKC